MEKTTFYTTVENQIREDGSKGLLYDHFDDVDKAYAKYYAILAEAAVSDIPYHAACIIRSDGIMIEGRVFDRRTEPVVETTVEDTATEEVEDTTESEETTDEA